MNMIEINNLPSFGASLSSIKKCDVVSFDVFDTLLKRNVEKPEDVFHYIEKKYKLDGFFKERIEAEKLARKIHKSREITLDDIYSCMNFKCRDLELKTESLLLVRNNNLFDLYNTCLKDKTVIITSDMYLPEEFIREILRREGYVNFKKMYLSSSQGVTKSSGKLFDYIKKDFGQDKKIIHIGDSIKSDYLMPLKHGIKAIHIPRKSNSNSFAIKSKSIGANVLNSFLRNVSLKSDSSYYKFGYEKFGPLLWGFSRWLHGKLMNNNIDRVYFFSRDGFIMKKAYDELFGDTKTFYMEVSRRSLRVPILWMDNDLNTFINMISPSKLIALSSVFDGLGLNVNDYLSLLEKYGFNKSTSFDRNSILKNNKFVSLYSELKKDSYLISIKEYKELQIYLKKFDLTDKFAIVDIGWSGGMQRYLTETLKKLGFHSNIVGYYFGVAEYCKRNLDVISDLNLNGFLFDFSKNKNSIDLRSSFVGLFETLFLEQNGSVVNYGHSSNMSYANRGEYEYIQNGKPTYEYMAVKEIQSGALDFIKRFKSIDIDLSPEEAFQGIKNSGEAPSFDDLHLFSNFRFFDEGKYSYLANPKSILFYLFHIKSFKRDFLSSRWKTGFLRKLFILKLPYVHFYNFLLKFK